MRLLISDKNVQFALHGLDADAVPLTISFPAHKPAEDFLHLDTFTCEFDIADHAPRVNRALEVSRISDQLVAVDGSVSGLEQTVRRDGIDVDARVSGGDLGGQAGARARVFERNVDVDLPGGDVDGGGVVDGEGAVELAVTEVDLGDALVAGGDGRDVEGDVAVGDVDGGFVAGVFEGAADEAVGDGEGGCVGVDGAGLDEAIGGVDGQGANLQGLGEFAVVDHVLRDVDLELGHAEGADNIGGDQDLCCGIGFQLAGGGGVDGEEAILFRNCDIIMLVLVFGLDVQVDNDLVGQLGGLEDDRSKVLGSLNSKAGGDSGIEFEAGGALEGLPLIDGRERVLTVVHGAEVERHLVSMATAGEVTEAVEGAIEEHRSKHENEGASKDASDQAPAFGLGRRDRCRKHVDFGHLLVGIENGSWGHSDCILLRGIARVGWNVVGAKERKVGVEILDNKD